MSYALVVMGESGSGKSTSLRTLDHKSTFVINVEGKPLPFKGWKKKYTQISRDNNPKGNYTSTDTAINIIKVLDFIDKKREDIKTVVIDDMQYIMANEYMRRAKEGGWDRFNDIGQNMWNVIQKAKSLRDDLVVVFLTHIETTDEGKVKIKTIGKMLDDKITLEGMFTIVLFSRYDESEGRYVFDTQTNGRTRAKSPFGMFGQRTIDNDMKFVIDSIVEYNEDEEEETKEETREETKEGEANE